MKQDTFKTEVKFLIEKPEGDLNCYVFAFFPKMEYFHYPSDTKSCYAHIGQHSACHLDYANECKAATEAEYLPLMKELETIGYNLKIIQ